MPANQHKKDNDKNSIQQEVPGLQAFTFSVVTVNDEHRKPRLGVKFKERSGLKTTGIFAILLSQDGFENDSPERKS